VHARLTKLLKRFYPGLELRPVGLALLSALLLTLYSYHGSFGAMPAGFARVVGDWTGIRDNQFHQHNWAHLTALLLLFVIPAWAASVSPGLSLRELGLGVKGAGREFLVVLGMWAAFVPVIWLASTTDSFLRTYPRLKAATHDPKMYFLYEGLYFVKWIAWEFFFRGFMLFGLRKDFGDKAALLSTLPFVIMHFGKPEAEMLGAILAGMILCAIALRSKSIWPGVLLHWMVASTMDFFAARWWR